MAGKAADRFWELLGRFGRHDQVVLGVLAAIVGAAAAYGAIAFREVADLVAHIAYGAGEQQIPGAARAMPVWQAALVPAVGGLLLGLAYRYLLPPKLPQAVTEVIEASALRNGRMSWRYGWSAALVSAYSIGIGGSVGREGPIVHLGASMAAYVAKRLHLSISLARTLLGCGVAAAIAAAFNAPIAGVFFALEVVVGHYGVGAFSPVVIASVMGTIITRVHIGDEPAFGLAPQHITSFWEVPAFLLLGVVCAFAAIAFMAGIALVQKAHARLGVPGWLQPAIAGLALGLLAIAFPEILGVGYEVTTGALTNQLELQALILLALAKAVGTMLCLGSRFGGGIFSPSLAIGALAGGAFGMIAGSLFPGFGSSPSVYAILGMGAVAASTLGAPISTVIMIFELTTDYGVTFALMASVAVASLVTRGLYADSFFHWQLKERGLSLEGQRELGLLRDRRVADVMRGDYVAVPADAGLDELKTRFLASHAPIFVVDGEGRLQGSISIEDLAEAAFEAPEENNVTAASLARRHRVVLMPEDDLAKALRRCQTHHEDHIPVVSDGHGRKVIGEVRFADLIEAYNRALLEARAIEQGKR